MSQLIATAANTTPGRESCPLRRNSRGYHRAGNRNAGAPSRPSVSRASGGAQSHRQLRLEFIEPGIGSLGRDCGRSERQPTLDPLRAYIQKIEFGPPKCQKQPEPNFPVPISGTCCANNNGSHPGVYVALIGV
jgi:hypothetical protein